MDNRTPPTGWTPPVAKTCPTCGAPHHDGLYLTCDECRGRAALRDYTPEAGAAVSNADFLAAVRDAYSKVREQNAAALNGRDFLDVCREQSAAYVAVMGRPNATEAKILTACEGVAEIERYIAANYSAAELDERERERDHRAEINQRYQL